MGDLTTICGREVTTRFGEALASLCGRTYAGGGTGPEIGDVPAPTHYWGMASSPFVDPNTSNGWEGVGGDCGMEAAAGGVSGNAANYDETGQLLNAVNITSATSRLIVSGWIKDSVGASLLDLLVDLDGGSNFESLRANPSNATVWDGSTWRHLLLDWNGTAWRLYLDGSLYAEDTEFASGPSLSAKLRISAGTGTGQIDEVYVWADPTMGTLTGAQMAALIYNAGAGAVWNGSTWTEL